MATININGQMNDIFGRYKMPKLEIKIEGKGTGTKTVLVNISTIGKALYRPPIYIVKFFGYELGAAVRADTKENRYIISGIRDNETLQNILSKFIERFVLCPICDNPETELILRERKIDEIYKVCTACGYHGQDNMESQKLTTFIARNLRDTVNEKKNSIIVDAKPDEVLKTDDVDGAFGDDSLEYNQFTILVEKKKTENKLNDIDTIKEIITNAEHFKLMGKAPFFIAKCLFTENILKEIDEYKILFQQLCQKNIEGQKYLLYALEVLINDNNTIRRQICNTKTISEILYKFYHEDIIDQETFIHWNQKPSKRFINKATSKKIRQMATEFIQWLNQPDTSDSDNEES